MKWEKYKLIINIIIINESRNWGMTSAANEEISRCKSPLGCRFVPKLHPSRAQGNFVIAWHQLRPTSTQFELLVISGSIYHRPRWRLPPSIQRSEGEDVKTSNWHPYNSVPSVKPVLAYFRFSPQRKLNRIGVLLTGPLSNQTRNPKKA